MREKDVYRSVPDLSIEETTEGEPTILRGHFSTYDPYEIHSFIEGNFIERIEPGAFADTFREDRDSIRLLLDHGQDPRVGDRPLGVITKLEEDERGAYYEAELFDTPYVNELLPALRAKQYGASFRFRVRDGQEEWDEAPERSDSNPSGIPERRIKSVQIREIGPTTWGANPNATATVRSLADRVNPELALEKRKAVEGLHCEDDEHRQVEDEPQGAHAGEVESESNVRATATQKEETMPKRAEDPKKTGAESEEETDKRERYDEDGNPDPEGQFDKDGNRLEEDDRVEDEEDDESEEDEQPEDKEDEEEDEDTEAKPAKRSRALPKSYEERAARIAEIDARHAAIDAEYGDNDLTRSAQGEYDRLEAERARLVAANKAIEERRARVAERADSGSVETVRGAATVTRKPENVYDVDEVRKNSYSHEGFVRGLRDNAKRIIEERSFDASPVDGAKNQEAVSKLLALRDNKNGDLAKLIMTTGSEAYRSGFTKFVTSKGAAYLESDEARAMSLGTDTAGGYRVPFDLDPSIILTSDGVVNPIRQLARTEKIIGKRWQGVTSAGVVLDMDGEAVEVDDDSPTLAQPEANAHRASAYVPYSIELDESDAGLISGITMVIQDGKDRLEAAQLVNGTGDGLTGVQGLVAGLPPTSHVETDDFSAADVFALDDELAPRHRANANFIGSKKTFNAVRQFGTTDGYALWERLGGGNPSQLIGYNAHEASTVPAAEVDGDPFLVLGDFKKYLVVDRIGMVMDAVPHVFGTNHRPTGQKALVAYWWFGGLLLDPNAFRGLVQVAP